METAYDILFFWVARMIMDGLVFTGQVPFHTVYLHGLIRDEHGKKMSKSYGNVIDPLPVMDEFGTDALRFTLLVGSTPGHDTNVGLKKVESNRNFANKIWNAGRFVINSINSPKLGAETDNYPPTDADKWILAKLRELTRNVDHLFQTFQYGEAGKEIYEFFWFNFADYCVEYAKNQIVKGRVYNTAKTLSHVLDASLRLLHPFTPYVTEELWGHLRSTLLDSPLAELAKDWTDALIVARWPEPLPKEDWEDDIREKFDKNWLPKERLIRNVRADKKIHPSVKIPATFSGPSEEIDFIKGHIMASGTVSGLDESQLRFFYDRPLEMPENTIILTTGSVETYLHLDSSVDQNEEHSRLLKELAEAESQVARLEKLLSSDFANKAPAPVVAKEREKLAGFKETAEKLKGQLG